MPLPFFERATTVPPVDAAIVRVTEQVADWPAVSSETPQESDDTAGSVVAALTVRDVLFELPFALADTFTRVSCETVALAVAVKLAEADPEGTVTEEGTLNSVLVLERETASPPLGAALLKLTVQDVL